MESRIGLREALLARCVTLAGLALASAMAYQFLAASRPALVLALGAVAFAVLNIATAWRLGSARPVGAAEPLAHLVADVAGLTVLFYLVGGATNPFVDLYLVPLAVAAARLPRTHALLVALLILAAYLLLTASHVPLPPERPGVRGFDCVSMWLKFALCGGFVGYLLYGLAALVREREARLRQALRRQVNESHLLYAGSLAAGAAHEIRSPLCTMSVLVNDLLREPHDGARCASSLRMVSDQIEACRRILAELMSYGQGVVEADARLEPVDRFLHGVVDKWRLLRPGVELVCRRQGPLPAPSIAAPVALGHAVLNLLNNAADASPQEVELACAWTATEVSLQVLDRGPGIPPELRAILGEKPASTKHEKGKGIGLLLARSAVERAGGTLTLGERPDGGACAQIVVPASAGEPVQDASPAFGTPLYAERI